MKLLSSSPKAKTVFKTTSAADQINLFVTTGDPDGIGFEVTAKALLLLPKIFFTKTNVFVFVTDSFQKKYLRILKEKFEVLQYSVSSSDFNPFIENQLSKSIRPILHFVVASDSPADWIYSLSRLCVNKPLSSALVTGPLSKTLIKSSGYSAIGHTEILSQVTKASPLYMGFVGKYFSVVLMTGHISLKRVSAKIKTTDWSKLIMILKPFVKRLAHSKRPIALVGLNPHAGENGLISGGEDDYLARQIKILNNSNSAIGLEGPLVPDAAFLKKNWSRYSVFLCPYHDQGLIPFKAIHGQDSGVHVTLGLPFVRTSVDHGTAKDIFNQNKANPNSMKEALLMARKLLIKA